MGWYYCKGLYPVPVPAALVIIPASSTNFLSHVCGIRHSGSRTGNLWLHDAVNHVWWWRGFFFRRVIASSIGFLFPGKLSFARLPTGSTRDCMAGRHMHAGFLLFTQSVFTKLRERRTRDALILRAPMSRCQ